MSNHHVSPSSPSTTSFPSCHTHQVQSSYLSIMTCPSCSIIMPSPAYPLIMSFPSCHTHHVLPIMSNHHVVPIMSYPSCHIHHVQQSCLSIKSFHYVVPIMSSPSCTPIMSYPSCPTIMSSHHVISIMFNHHCRPHHVLWGIPKHVFLSCRFLHVDPSCLCIWSVEVFRS